ncbi:MAG TPA: hypothetical protein VK996_05245, partial [Ramlibacter sp.]|nr:hypothetical protein [Ramlibacter sp.]
MIRSIRLLFAACLAFHTLIAQAGEPTPADIDKIFAAWNKPDTPGVSLAVVRDGKIIYGRGYGL